MTPRQLRRHIKRLPAITPLHKCLEAALCEGVGYGNAWYGSQKEHWLGWLREYRGQGAYGRSTSTSAKDAAYVWNHIQCAPMLLWLPEALELPDAKLAAAYDAALYAQPNGASKCRAIRQVFPWPEIETALLNNAPLSWRLRFTKQWSKST